MSYRDWRLVEQTPEVYRDPSRRKAGEERRQYARRRGGYQRILVALQGRGRDEIVLDHVQKLAGQLGAKVTLLRAIPVANDGGGGFGQQFQTEVGSSGWRRSNEAEAYLAQVERRLWLQGQPAEGAVVFCSCSEGEEIVRYASEQGFDMIAMARDSRPWYKRWFGGSPAGEVQRKATVPALFVGDGACYVPAARAEPALDPITAAFSTAELSMANSAPPYRKTVSVG